MFIEHYSSLDSIEMSEALLDFSYIFCILILYKNI